VGKRLELRNLKKEGIFQILARENKNSLKGFIPLCWVEYQSVLTTGVTESVL
jgi:hypothetical protein